MDIKRYLKRLDALERILLPEPLIVRARLPDGSIKEVTMRECLEKDLEFIKVTGGHNLTDLDLLLAEIEKGARHDEEEY